jgi:hypothetical protein
MSRNAGVLVARQGTRNSWTSYWGHCVMSFIEASFAKEREVFDQFNE